MSSEEPPRNATVLPLDGRLAERDPWQLLASGDGMLVSWTDGPSTTGRAWGGPLRATSAISRQINGITVRAAGVATVVSGTRTFRLEIPTGYGVEDLMGAVGGGFRTAVRAPGSSRITGHARLVPLASTGRRLIASGPLLGLMAVTIAAEMAAGNAQDLRLTAILDGVERLNAHVRMETDARLHTAEQAIRQAHAALLDGAVIPESTGLGTAMSHLQVIRNQYTTLLAGWERVAAELPPDETSGDELRATLGNVGKLGWDEFPGAVRTAYLSITLDSRRIMLTAAEAQLRNPGLPLSSFRQAVESDLAVRTAELNRLRSLLVRLSTVALTTSWWSGGLLPHLVTGGADENARTQALLATLAAAFSGASDSALHVSDDRIIVEAEVRPDGEVQLFRH